MALSGETLFVLWLMTLIEIVITIRGDSGSIGHQYLEQDLAQHGIKL